MLSRVLRRSNPLFSCTNRRSLLFVTSLPNDIDLLLFREELLGPPVIIFFLPFRGTRRPAAVR